MMKTTEDIQKEKRLSGEAAAALVVDGMTIGLGTGSTAAFAIRAIGRRMREEGLTLSGVCTSSGTETIAREEGIPIHGLIPGKVLDIYIDGADQINPAGNMIKGGGAALLREKMVALASRHRVIISDVSKRVDVLGRSFPLPVEIIRYGHDVVIDRLAAIDGCHPKLRASDSKPTVTDEGHYIADCHFPHGIDDPVHLEKVINLITGVVDCGLFNGLCDLHLYGDGDTVHETRFSR